MLAGFTTRLLRRRFLGSIRSGIRCGTIRASKNSARKSSRETILGNHRRQTQQGRLELGCVSAVTREGRIIWVADAHRGDGQRFVVHADEKLAAFVELEAAIKHESSCEHSTK